MTAIIKTNKKAVAKLKKVAEKLSKEMRPQINAAINDTTKQLRTWMSARVREKLAAKKKDIDKKLNRRISQVNRLHGRLYISEFEIGLSKFTKSQVKLGVQVKINKEGSRTFFPKHFGPKREKLKPMVYKRETEKPFPLVSPPPMVFKEEVKRWGIDKQARANIKEIFKVHIGRRIHLMKLRATGKVAETKYSY